MENVNYIRVRMSKCPDYTDVVNIDEIEYWLDNYNETIVCNGYLREIVFTECTKNRFEYVATTKPILVNEENNT